MKFQIHTSPVAEAFASADECPFCRLEREAEQRAIRFYAGPSASYMEPEIRELTNQNGFCGHHTKKLYDYGNALGNALMLQTHMADMMQDLERLELRQQESGTKKRFRRSTKPEQAAWEYLQQRSCRCVICDQTEDSLLRHYRVFFSLLKEPEFRKLVEDGNGFCIPHFARILQEAGENLPHKHAEWFYATIFRVMRENLCRVKQDLDHLISKYDYRNAGLDWGNSRDALQRSMQKIAGIYPADPPYRKE